MSDIYSFYANGYCLGHLVPDGSLLEADPSQEIRSGHLVAVVLKKGGPFKGFSESLDGSGLLGVTKIFMGTAETKAGEHVYLLGQLDPPTVVTAPVKYLEAMHLVIGGREPPWVSEEITDEDDADLSASLDLLSPFLRGGVVQPIGSDWRPPQ
ncbi:hypothetical protein [Mesorhizobium muleiense]|uniref:Uncharacterized protein n=1 Tax=Mesorhizobium muleiense TaxID=1004279 RepID=A0A1G8IZB3_9HYPH|nr:hypothetical protein [Mesorhizobium muleiense]MCF6099831.1 hypothetical protein [Mesorhizobium muleiense]SDI24395.1 hypothetical protein SAMN05428953_101539 [Mesorhizobium muleiense]